MHPFQRVAMEHFRSRSAIIIRLYLFEEYFRQQKLQWKRIKPYDMAQVAAISFKETAAFSEEM